jgi:type II secretory pathway pseudopilin PulG
MTLVEVMVAMTILATVCAGLLGGMVQSRRLTEGSNAQASAQAAVESYLEQLENMDIHLLVGNAPQGAPSIIPNWAANYDIPTQQDSTLGGDPLRWSNTGTGSPAIPQLETLTPGVTPGTPAGIVDNLKEIPFNPNNQGVAATWASIWPNAINTTNPDNSANPKTNTLHMNIWVWVTDLTAANSNPSAANPTAFAQSVYGITIIYTWQFYDGFGTQYFMGTLHAVRSPIS